MRNSRHILHVTVLRLMKGVNAMTVQMAASEQNLSDLLSQAQLGSGHALGEALEACRAYLLLVAQSELDPNIRAKGGASDLVQETFLEAQRDFQQFRGTSEEELLAWLRQVLLNNLKNFARSYRQTAKRDVQREVKLEAGRSTLNWRDGLPDCSATPSRVMMKEESVTSLNEAMSRLPHDYQQIILFRYQEEHTFDEISRLMDRTPNAVRKLWSRAIERLQKEMG